MLFRSLFLAYINDLPDCVKYSQTRLFADDALLFRKVNSEADRKHLQQDLKALETWESQWQMSFNPSKCSVVSISPGKKKKTTTPPCYNLHGQTLEVTDSSKYLGVTIKNDLTWSQHIDASTAKANRTVGFLKRNFSRCSSTPKPLHTLQWYAPSLNMHQLHGTHT